MAAGIAIVISVAALIVAYLSWRTSLQSIRASMYDRRYEIYADAEKFIAAWMRDARPDMGELPTIVGAWNRSQFLFDEEVTKYLREVWVDAVAANQARQEGREDFRAAEALLLKHGDFDKLRAVFREHLKVK